MKFTKQMYTGINIKSTDGFHVVRLPAEEYVDALRKFKAVKKWCGDMCAGSWGFSSCHTVSFMYSGSRFVKTAQSFFAFADKQDALMLKLVMNEVCTAPTWNSTTKFNIIVHLPVDNEVEL